MRTWILTLGFLLLARPSFSVVQLGETVPDMCWNTSENWMLCLSDIRSAVVVLMYGAGWCPGCNDEASEVASRFSEMNGKPVIFISLSSEGFSHGAPVDQAFLNSWKQKHKIPFHVAAAPRDPGKQFFSPPNYIPAVAVIDGEGKLAFKDIEPPISKLFQEVNRLIKEIK